MLTGIACVFKQMPCVTLSFRQALYSKILPLFLSVLHSFRTYYLFIFKMYLYSVTSLILQAAELTVQEAVLFYYKNHF